MKIQYVTKNKNFKFRQTSAKSSSTSTVTSITSGSISALCFVRRLWYIFLAFPFPILRLPFSLVRFSFTKVIFLSVLFERASLARDDFLVMSLGGGRGSFTYPFSMAGTARFFGEGLRSGSSSPGVSLGIFVFRAVSILFSEEFENFLVLPVSQNVSYSSPYNKRKIINEIHKHVCATLHLRTNYTSFNEQPIILI